MDRFWGPFMSSNIQVERTLNPSPQQQNPIEFLRHKRYRVTIAQRLVRIFVVPALEHRQSCSAALWGGSCCNISRTRSHFPIHRVRHNVTHSEVGGTRDTTKLSMHFSTGIYNITHNPVLGATVCMPGRGRSSCPRKEPSSEPWKRINCSSVTMELYLFSF